MTYSFIYILYPGHIFKENGNRCIHHHWIDISEVTLSKTGKLDDLILMTKTNYA